MASAWRNAKISPIFYFDRANNSQICHIMCVKGKMIRGTVWFHRLSIAASYRDAVKIPWIPWLLRMGSIIGAMYKTGLITHTIR